MNRDKKMSGKSKGSCTVSFPSETAKIRPKVLKYVQGKSILDYGCGGDKVVPHALGIDIRPLPDVDLVTGSVEAVYDLTDRLQNYEGNTDAIYSSHFLEHVADDKRLMRSWVKMLKEGGYLVLYLPDDKKYDNKSNPEHLQIYTHDVFVKEFLPQFSELETIDHGTDYGEDRYSFFTVSRKRKV